MPFTDEDLKRLKIHLDTPHEEIMCEFNIRELNALLARLEAAEDCIGVSAGYCSRYPKFDDAFEAWRKAAGKK